MTARPPSLLLTPSTSNVNRLLQLLPLPDKYRTLVISALLTLDSVLLYLKDRGPTVPSSELAYYHLVLLEKHLPICRALYFLDERLERPLDQFLAAELFLPHLDTETLVPGYWDPSAENRTFDDLPATFLLYPSTYCPTSSSSPSLSHPPPTAS